MKFTKRPAEEIWSRHLVGTTESDSFTVKIDFEKNMKQCSVGCGPNNWKAMSDSVLIGEDKLSVGYQNCGYIYLFGILVCKDLPSYEDGDNITWGISKESGFLYFLKNNQLIWCCSLYDRSEVLAKQAGKKILDFIQNFVPVVSMVQSQKFSTKFTLKSEDLDSSVFKSFGAKENLYDL